MAKCEDSLTSSEIITGWLLYAGEEPARLKKNKTPGVIGVLIGFGFFGNVWFSLDSDTLPFDFLGILDFFNDVKIGCFLSWYK